MKTPIFISLLAALFLIGCGDNQSQPAQSNNSGSPLNAPADYAGALARGQTAAIKTVDIASLNEAIQMFYVQEGRFPKNLNELVEGKTIAKIPDTPRGMKFDYNAATGKIRVVNDQ